MPAHTDGNETLFEQFLPLLFFPYAHLWSDWNPLYHHRSPESLDLLIRFVLGLAPLPLFGLILSLCAGGRHFRIVLWCIVVIHASAVAAAEIFTLW